MHVFYAHVNRRHTDEIHQTSGNRRAFLTLVHENHRAPYCMREKINEGMLVCVVRGVIALISRCQMLHSVVLELVP